MKYKEPDIEKIKQTLNKIIKPLTILAAIGAIGIIIIAMYGPMIEIIKITSK